MVEYTGVTRTPILGLRMALVLTLHAVCALEGV